MPQYFRYLRFAFSATCGIACALLIVLWVRSYSNGPGKGYFNSLPYVHSRSTDGVVIFFKKYSPPVEFPTIMFTDPLSTRPKAVDHNSAHPRTGFSFGWESSWYWHLQMPYWMLVTMTVALATMPWIAHKWRFSLRTLLIATTLIAVVLGLIVWLGR